MEVGKGHGGRENERHGPIFGLRGPRRPPHFLRVSPLLGDAIAQSIGALHDAPGLRGGARGRGRGCIVP